MLGRGLSLVNADGREWSPLNQRLFSDNTALMADLEGRL